MIKFILILLLIYTSSSYCEEAFVGANIGGSKSSFGRTSNIFGYNMAYAQQNRYGLNAIICAGKRYPLPEHILLGYELDFGIERTMRKEQTLMTKITAKRDYFTNILVTLGFKENSPIMPYVMAGGSFTSFTIRRDTDHYIEKKKIRTLGWCAGVGADYAVSDTTYIGIQFLYTYYGEKSRAFLSGASSPLYLYSPESYNLISIGIKFII